jgi:hypothetical protein
LPPSKSIRFPSFSPANPHVFPTIEKKRKNILTLSTLSSMLSSAMKTALQKLLSAVALSITYAVLGYGFYWFFIVTQF